MSGNQKDGKVKDDVKEEDHFRALMKLSPKFPNSVAFADFADARVSAEQRLLEMKLETLINQFYELQKQRIDFWSTPNGPSPFLLEKFDPPNLLELRRQRLAEITTAGKPNHPFEASSLANALQEVSSYFTLALAVFISPWFPSLLLSCRPLQSDLDSVSTLACPAYFENLPRGP